MMILKPAMKKTSTRKNHHNKRLVRVQFRDYITVIPFHKVSRDEAKAIWMTDADLTRNKNIGIQIAYTYRRMIEREQHLVSIKQQQQQQDQEQDQQEQEQEQEGRTRLPASSPASSYIPPSSSSAKIAADCRGFECCTVVRNRNKFLLNRWALHYANNSNNWEMKTNNKNSKNTTSTSNTTAMLYYQKCNAWSTKVGLVQAIHDYMEVYGNEASFVSSHEHNSKTSRGNGDTKTSTSTSRSITKSRKLEALQKLPPVWSMIPPTAAYYERHVARAQQQLQEQQQQAQSQSPPRSSEVVASRKRTRPQPQGEGRTVSPSLSPQRTGTTATSSSTVSYSPCVTSRSHVRRRLNIVVVE